jgi:hypothetical protein
MPWTPKQATFMRFNHPSVFKREVQKYGSDIIKAPKVKAPKIKKV